MRNLVPLRNSVLCRKLNLSKEIASEGSIFIPKNNVDLYEIVRKSEMNDTEFDFEIGDVVISKSTGDELEVNKNEKYYLFKNENIMCKIEE